MTTTFSFKLTWQEGDGYQVLYFHQDPQTSADLPLKHTHTHLNQISPPFHTHKVTTLLWGIQKPSRSNSSENLSPGRLKIIPKLIGHTYKTGSLAQINFNTPTL